MNDRNEVQEAPNYLNANIAMFGVNLTWMLFFLWATLGFAAVLVAAVIINLGLTILQSRLTQEPQRPHSPHRE